MVILNKIATVDEHHLTITKAPDTFELATVCRIYPEQNSKLMGIYTSSTGFLVCVRQRVSGASPPSGPPGRDGPVQGHPTRRPRALSRFAGERQPN